MTIKERADKEILTYFPHADKSHLPTLRKSLIYKDLVNKYAFETIREEFRATFVAIIHFIKDLLTFKK